ncbi:hypothetical protein MKZ38_008211 [Zalerion maritima]|uniref:Uncharacterized protein n=1 Tax=Zalerion maritima TaxID=339359 RepID=A0AAD5RHG2_9PEZI|nr:hypothetical protein MKZ38_008211 [Zalerion maritima]
MESNELESPGLGVEPDAVLQSRDPGNNGDDGDDDNDTERAHSPSISTLKEQYDELKVKVTEVTDRAAKSEAGEASTGEQLRQVYQELSERGEKTENIEGKYTNALKKIMDLNAELQDARFQISTKHPYQGVLDAEEVAWDYNKLLDKVFDWAVMLMCPIVESVDAFEKLFSVDRSLMFAAHYPFVDSEIVTAIIMRFLYNQIFCSSLYGVYEGHVDLITQLEENLKQKAEPKRDLFSIRNWRAEAFSALLLKSDFRTGRKHRAEELSKELTMLFEALSSGNGISFLTMTQGFRDSCVLPAMKLYEKNLTSTADEFYVDWPETFTEVILGEDDPATGQREERLVSTDKFFDSLDHIEGKNVIGDKSKFDWTQKTEEERKMPRDQLRKKLRALSIIAPAILMRKISGEEGDGNYRAEPVVVSKSRMLVSYGLKALDRQMCGTDEDAHVMLDLINYEPPEVNVLTMPFLESEDALDA